MQDFLYHHQALFSFSRTSFDFGLAKHVETGGRECVPGLWVNDNSDTPDDGEIRRGPFSLVTSRHLEPEDATADNSDVTPKTVEEAEVESQSQKIDLDAVTDEISTGVCEAPEIREIDLLTLANGKSKRLLDCITVPVGDYPWRRLEIDENQPGYMVLDDGTTHDLTMPGAANTGLKLVSGFSEVSDGKNQILIDFDLRKSVHKAGSNYRLKPALRLLKIDNVEKQRWRGEWLAEAMGQCESPMAYIYEGADVVPDDIGGAGVQPLLIN